MRRWLASLGGRITLVTVSVAVLAVVITGLISLQLVRASTLDDAKAQLAAQALLLSKIPNANIVDLGERVKLALGDTKVGLVAADGEITGPAAPYIGPVVAKRLANHKAVSLVQPRLGETVVIEARPARAGTSVVLVRTESSVRASTAESTRRIVIALVIGVIVAILAGLLLGRWLSKPLRVTAAKARRLAAGERGLPLATRGPTEIADVAEALAVLDRALTTSEGRQREFLLSISHELRTPLTAVRGYGEAMADGLVKQADIASVGATLVAETERLDRFVADLLELARLEADDFVIDEQEFPVAGLLERVQSAWQGRASTLGVSIVVNSHDATVHTDERRLRQVLDGLVENALRATPSGGTVWLDAAGTSIEVRDSGPGLTADDLAVAFDRGALHARYRNTRPVGTGLGLSIAARLVERLGGTISVANDADGGARFTVSLP